MRTSEEMILEGEATMLGLWQNVNGLEGLCWDGIAWKDPDVEELSVLVGELMDMRTRLTVVVDRILDIVQRS